MPVTPSAQSVVNITEKKITDGTPGCCSIISEWYCAQWRPFLAEFAAMTLLILLGCMSTIPLDGLPYQPPMYAAFCFGCVVMFNIQIFGHISGAHMNPAVTLAAMIWGSMSIPTGIAYFLAQFAGATLGYVFLSILSPMDIIANGVCVTQPHAGLNQWQAFGVEIALTSALNFLNCGVWDPVNKDKPDSVPLKFGIAIIGLSLAGGPLTGASMNPTRSLVPALITGSWKDHWIYWAGPIIGGIAPTLLYKFIWIKKDNPLSKMCYKDSSSYKVKGEN